MKKIYTVRTKDRQGEYLKAKYDNIHAEYWNHFTATTKKKAENRARELNLKNYWIDNGSVTRI